VNIEIHGIISPMVDRTRPKLAAANGWSDGSFGWLADLKGLDLSDLTYDDNNLKEDSMKIFEAIVVQLEDETDSPRTNATRQPIDIVKVIGPTLAKSASEFAQEVLFDYGIEASLSGKDLAGFQVRVREFQVTV
jgi:hypothetical protein